MEYTWGKMLIETRGAYRSGSYMGLLSRRLKMVVLTWLPSKPKERRPLQPTRLWSNWEGSQSSPQKNGGDTPHTHYPMSSRTKLRNLARRATMQICFWVLYWPHLISRWKATGDVEFGLNFPDPLSSASL